MPVEMPWTTARITETTFAHVGHPFDEAMAFRVAAAVEPLVPGRGFPPFG
ncbi:hypothetical protein [Paeniglutamicibacter psychrophenolicus]|nr:hypothetical protein [Paeniglutamicibacter psychrophenolicus]MDQ0093106.1 hypothetical protein [Paeniglutamicibacter psychrophenolicus]